MYLKSVVTLTVILLGKFKTLIQYLVRNFLANVPDGHLGKSKEPLVALEPQVADPCSSQLICIKRKKNKHQEVKDKL